MDTKKTIETIGFLRKEIVRMTKKIDSLMNTLEFYSLTFQCLKCGTYHSPDHKCFNCGFDHTAQD